MTGLTNTKKLLQIIAVITLILAFGISCSQTKKPGQKEEQILINGKIAYELHKKVTSEKEIMWQVYAMNADGTGQINLSNNDFDEGNVSW